MVETPQSAQRMAPATAGLYEAVINREVSHSADADLAGHVQNAHLRDDGRSVRLAKERRDSRRRIDLAVCAVKAHSRARYWTTRRPACRRAVSFSWSRIDLLHVLGQRLDEAASPLVALDAYYAGTSPLSLLSLKAAEALGGRLRSPNGGLPAARGGRPGRAPEDTRLPRRRRERPVRR